MESLIITAKQVAILFVMIGFGCACRWMKFIDDKSIKAIVNVLMMVVSPCLIVEVFQRPFEVEKLQGLGLAFVFGCLVHFMMILLAAVVFRRCRNDSGKVYKAVCVFSNAGFMGIPIEQAVLGDLGVFYGVVFTVVYSIFFWSYGILLMAEGKAGVSKREMWLNPGNLGILIGLILFVTSFTLPEIVKKPVAMLGSMNTPLAMIVLGFYLGGANFGKVVRSGGAYLSSAMRLLVCPILTIALFYPFRHLLDHTMMMAVVVPAAAPVGALVTVLAARYDGDVDTAAGTVSGTTLLSILTMPVVIALALEFL